jgi:hypothetical protein
MLLECLQLRILVEGLPRLRGFGGTVFSAQIPLCKVPWFVLEHSLLWRHILAAYLWAAPDRSQRFLFGTLDLGWVGPSPAFEVEVLADRVVK